MTATISLTFDDGLDAHLDVAMPVLEQAGLRGTFYVDIRSTSLGRRGGEWREAAARGHELGNHSLLHPAVRAKSWVREANALENYSLDRMRMELEVANNVLRALDGRTERTYAFPCSNPILGRPGLMSRALARLGLERTRLMGWVRRSGFDPGSRAADFTPIVRELFYAARCGGVARRRSLRNAGPPPRAERAGRWRAARAPRGGRGPRRRDRRVAGLFVSRHRRRAPAVLRTRRVRGADCPDRGGAASRRAHLPHGGAGALGTGRCARGQRVVVAPL